MKSSIKALTSWKLFFFFKGFHTSHFVDIFRVTFYNLYNGWWSSHSCYFSFPPLSFSGERRTQHLGILCTEKRCSFLAILFLTRRGAGGRQVQVITMWPRVLWIVVHHKNPPPSYFWQIQNVNLLVNIHSVFVRLSRSGQGNRCSGIYLPGGGSVQSRADVTVWRWKHFWSVKWLWFHGLYPISMHGFNIATYPAHLMCW